MYKANQASRRAFALGKDALLAMASLALVLTMTACQGGDKQAEQPQASAELAQAAEPQSSAQLVKAPYTGKALTPPEPEGFSPFIRIDRDDPEAWKGEIANVRLITKDRYELKTPDEKYGVPDVKPSEEGLDTLDISGSAQFSADQFHDFAQVLRECANGKEIYILDLRRESHALLNGISFSYYPSYNWSNRDYSLDEINQDQDERFGSMVGTTITAFPKKDNMPQGEGSTFDIESYQTEQELVEGEGLHYVRIPILDHSWPSPEEMDQFVDFVKSIDMDNSWLHFHCHAGKGRTGALMAAYDMMKNPNVPLEDIEIRQAMFGGTYLDYVDHEDSFKEKIYEERQAMAKLFYQYVQENKDSDYATPWSVWLASHAG